MSIQPTLQLNSGTPQSQTLELHRGVNRVGRLEGNDIQITHPTISSHHCELVVSEICVVVRDLGSTNGTFVDKKPVNQAVLQSGQTLQLGSVEMRFEAPEVTISVPEISKPEVRASAKLEDGALACLNHSGVRAAYKCPKCGNGYCAECIHGLRVAGGAARNFCPDCSVLCEAISSAKPKPKSFFGAIGDTLRLPFRK